MEGMRIKTVIFRAVLGCYLKLMINVPIWGGGAIDAHINFCLLEKGTFQKLLSGFFPGGVKYFWIELGLSSNSFLEMTCLGVVYHIQKDS